MIQPSVSLARTREWEIDKDSDPDHGILLLLRLDPGLAVGMRCSSSEQESLVWFMPDGLGCRWVCRLMYLT